MKKAQRRVAVATSGGKDSTALLHCTVRLAQAAGVQTVALHVHHGLMPQADLWLNQVQAQAKRWGADFLAHREDTQPTAGESIEAWARRVRYKALADMAHAAGCTAVLLAHHQQDQAETFLLQALRGAGPAGQSAMPVQAQRHGLSWCRPWLNQPRCAIEAYVQRHRLRFVEDASNTDPRFARSRLRVQVWPALVAAFPNAKTTLFAATQRAQEARALADEVACMDLQSLAPTDQPVDALHLRAWLLLSSARRHNALRAWLARVLARGAPETLVQRLLTELPQVLASASAQAARWPSPVGTLRLYRGLLSHEGACASSASTGVSVTQTLVSKPVLMDLSKAGCWPAPGWGGHFKVQNSALAGVRPAALRQVALVARTGGERFAFTPGAKPRSLKKQFQLAGVAEDKRQVPLVCAPDGRLIYVPGLGFNAAFTEAAPTGGPGPRLLLEWIAGAANASP